MSPYVMIYIYIYILIFNHLRTGMHHELGSFLPMVFTTVNFLDRSTKTLFGDWIMRFSLCLHWHSGHVGLSIAMGLP